MGFHYEDAASQWRGGRPLSTQTLYALSLEMKHREVRTLSVLVASEFS
jgi:hypothetical protein